MKISPVDRQINQNNNMNKSQSRSFNGAGDAAFNMLDKAFGVLDKNAMIQVSFVDTVSTNIPRTLVDLKTGLAAAFETCRREFSGLFVNCLMPGLVVKAIATLLPKSKELKDTNVAGSWANGASIERLGVLYKEAQKSGTGNVMRNYIESAVGSLEGLDGTTWVRYADRAADSRYKEAITNLTNAVSATGKNKKLLLKKAQSQLASVTKAESVLRAGKKPQANLEETLRDIVDMGSKYSTVREQTLSKLGKAGQKDVKNKVSEAIDKYGSSLKKFVNMKSLIGMGLVIGIAVSVQTINRAITRKQFKAEGAPIYKDFGKKDTTQKMDENQKKKFWAKKILSAAGMYGLAATSMMKKPSLGMFQFSGIFPTMDQCRWIAASTFASRMLGAEDDNELRETTVRDLASFSGLYFLGDYVKKGVASGIEKLSRTKKGAKLLGENVVLLNRKKVIEKPVIEKGASFAKKAAATIGYKSKQFGNWIKNTDLKSAAEVSSTKVRNMRNLCRVADIAFSVMMLGVLLPKYNRSVTEKKVAAAKLKEEQEKQANLSLFRKNNISEIFKNMINI